MTKAVFNMDNRIEAVDPMVLGLKARVEDSLVKEALLRFEICVIEALTNVVEHATPSSKEASVEIHLQNTDAGVVIEIFDLEGTAPFDLRDHVTDLSLVDEMAEGGRGLGLILQCADTVELGALSNRNRLYMSFDNVS